MNYKAALHSTTNRDFAAQYLTQRKGVFYFQFLIPKRLGDNVTFKKSLRTTNYYEALELAKSKAPVVKAIKQSTDPRKLKDLLVSLGDFSKIDRLRYEERGSVGT